MGMKVFFHDDYGASAYAFDTTRKALDVAASLRANGVPGVTLVNPYHFQAHAKEALFAVHDRAYVRAVRTGEPASLAESQGFAWDPGVFRMAFAHGTGVVAAALTAIETGGVHGTLSSGLHHARYDSGSGYCTFNGLAMAAQQAFAAGARRILVLDLDAHCGGGTYELTRDLGVVQVDVSTSRFDQYPVRDLSSLLRFADADDYLTVVAEVLEHAEQLGPWDLVLYNAGMDPFDSNVCLADLEQRERMVAAWVTSAGYPTAFTLAGGYRTRCTAEELAAMHRSTVEAFAAASSVDEAV